MRTIKRKGMILVVGLLLTIGLLGACAYCPVPHPSARQPDYYYTQQGAVIGGLSGSLLGHQIGEDIESTLFWALTGGLLGGMIGNTFDQQRQLIIEERYYRESRPAYPRECQLVPEKEYFLDPEQAIRQGYQKGYQKGTEKAARSNYCYAHQKGQSEAYQHFTSPTFREKALESE